MTRMNKTVYKQGDYRWGAKPYPKGATMAGSGCGCVSCTHIAIEQGDKLSWTPENLRKWMINQGFAIAGQGTRWEGITKTLQHIGHKKVVRIYDNDPMTDAWKELNKGKRIGVLLFSSGKGPDGTVWTTSGHYIAFTKYKVKGGQHWFYLKDSGPRNHIGWYCYEKSMKGCLPKLWIVERIPFRQAWFDAMSDQFKWSKNQKYEWVTPTVASSETKGTCITFPMVALQRLGLLPSGKYVYFNPDSNKMAGNAVNYVLNHQEIFKVMYPNKTITQIRDRLKVGDIVGYDNPAYHTMVFMGWNKKGQPIFNTMGYKRGLKVTYSAYADRKISMIIRLRKTAK